jgi:2-iminoacetate synthase
MKYINEKRIYDLLLKPATDMDTILQKSKKLQRLTLEEVASLLVVTDPEQLQKIFATAQYVKDMIYGKRVVLFAPLYISNICANNCVYCAFQSSNTLLERKALSPAEITKQTEWLLSRGHKRVLLVAGEAPPKGQKLIDYYVESIAAIYAARQGNNSIRRVNINCAPLEVDEFKKLKAAKIGTYQIFQETYHEETYRKVHCGGPKSDPDNRLSAVDHAFQAGIDDIGIGVLYGLYDYRFDTLALLMHIEEMERQHRVGPHTISVPRIEPAIGSDFSQNAPYAVSDLDFQKIVAVLRLAVPYTGIIMSTRESAQMRDALLNMGVSQVSAESNTAPGGYGSTASTSLSTSEQAGQFSTADHRTLDEVIDSLMQHGYVPSFCTGCYRKERTGEAFMNLAKPGLIKGKCNMNALITLKEYLDDFGSKDVQRKGYAYIQELEKKLSPDDAAMVKRVFADIEAGIRDFHV